MSQEFAGWRWSVGLAKPPQDALVGAQHIRRDPLQSAPVPWQSALISGWVTGHCEEDRGPSGQRQSCKHLYPTNIRTIGIVFTGA